MYIESVMPSNHLILCRPLLLSSIFPSIRVFSNDSVLQIRWTKYWSFSFSISPSNEYIGLISFRMDWLDLFAVQVVPCILSTEDSPSTFFKMSCGGAVMPLPRTTDLQLRTTLYLQENRVKYLWRRFPGKGNGNPLQYSCLGNPMDKGAWWTIVHGTSKSQI